MSNKFKMKKFFSKFDTTFEQPQANFIGKVFNIGRQTVTVDEMIAEGESLHKNTLNTERKRI